jgi:NAD(P)-dependent dehydrogenase (short-subunit alcohol dehydrogenase family)
MKSCLPVSAQDSKDTAFRKVAARGIGRGIALKLQRIVLRLPFITSATRRPRRTLEKVLALGSNGFLLQADVCGPEEVRRLFQQVCSEFGSLHVFVSNARPEASTFYEAPMDITLDNGTPLWIHKPKHSWSGCARQFHGCPDGGRIIAISFAPGGRFGSWQPWVAMGAAKAAMAKTGLERFG